VARLERIWSKRAKRGPMDPRDEADLVAEQGLRDSADQGGFRQVTVISAERWAELMDELGADLDPGTRRANLMVSGLDLEDCRDRVLRIGSCRLAMRGETRPCERMDEALPGLRQAMRARWGGGAFAQVVAGGRIRVGDAVAWE